MPAMCHERTLLKYFILLDDKLVTTYHPEAEASAFRQIKK